MAVLNIKSLFMTMAVLVVVVFGSTEAQTPSCASKLKPCYNIVTSDNQPPAACCDNLKEGLVDDFECICTLFTTTIPADQAPWLINECGIHAGISLCTTRGLVARSLAASGPDGSPSPAPSPSDD